MDFFLIQRFSKFIKIVKNGLYSEWFFFDFFKENPPIFLQNLNALEKNFSKLVLHAQIVHFEGNYVHFK